MAVRVLALIAALSAVTAVLEARAIRSLRSELQTLRTEHESVKAGVTITWAAQSVDEVDQAVRWLNTFYGEAAEGFGRPGGLCATGELNAQDLTRFAFGAFLPARAAGRSMADSIDAMKTAIRRTDEYRKIHPNLALENQ